jgi:hypothetical protein
MHCLNDVRLLKSLDDANNEFQRCNTRSVKECWRMLTLPIFDSLITLGYRGHVQKACSVMMRL